MLIDVVRDRNMDFAKVPLAGITLVGPIGHGVDPLFFKYCSLEPGDAARGWFVLSSSSLHLLTRSFDARVLRTGDHGAILLRTKHTTSIALIGPDLQIKSEYAMDRTVGTSIFAASGDAQWCAYASRQDLGIDQETRRIVAIELLSGRRTYLEGTSVRYLGWPKKHTRDGSPVLAALHSVDDELLYCEVDLATGRQVAAKKVTNNESDIKSIWGDSECRRFALRYENGDGVSRLCVADVASGAMEVLGETLYEPGVAWARTSPTLSFVTVDESGRCVLRIVDFASGRDFALGPLNSGDQTGEVAPPRPIWTSRDGAILLPSMEKDGSAILSTREPYTGLSVEAIAADGLFLEVA